jgi:sialate O-acetylesterase
VRVAFRNAGAGLKLTDGAAPRTFELVEKGDKGVPVEARLVGKSVVELTVPEGMGAPTRVRYAWSPDPNVNLVNSADLPATPFEIELQALTVAE